MDRLDRELQDLDAVAAGAAEAYREGRRAAWRRACAFSAAAAGTLVLRAPDWWQHGDTVGWALVATVACVALAARAGRWLAVGVLVAQPVVLLGAFGAAHAAITWEGDYALSRGYDRRVHPDDDAGCRTERETGLRSCVQRPSMSCFGPDHRVPMAAAGATWVRLATRLVGPPPSAWPGPWLDEDTLGAWVARAEPAPLDAEALVARFDARSEAGWWLTRPAVWADREHLAVAEVGERGLLLVWDHGREVELRDRRTGWRIQAWPARR